MDANINLITHAGIATPHWWMHSAAGANASSAFAATLARAKRAAHAKRAQRRATLHSTLADNPPPEVEREMDTAASVSRTLAAQGQELRFGRNRDGRVSVELTDAAGRALRAIAPSELFQLLSQGD
jgi:hypothetical protein